MEMALGKRIRLADVVKQSGHTDEGPIGGRVDGAQSVVPQILTLDLVLAHPPLPLKVRGQNCEQARLRHEPKSDRGRRRRQELGEFGADSFSRQVAGQLRAPSGGLECGGLQGEVQGRRKPDRANHPQRVFVESLIWVAHGSEKTP